jgi:hypothetical protein
MSVKLNRPLKPEESQKDSNFNGKTILYPGFKPGTSGLAVGSHTAPFGSVYHRLNTLIENSRSPMTVSEIERSKNLIQSFLVYRSK